MRRKAINKKMLWIIIIFLVVFLLLLVFLSLFKLEQVVVKGNSFYSEDQIKDKLFTSPLDQFAVFFYLRGNWKNTNDIPFIEDIEIELVDKNSVQIYVYEKAIAGCVEMTGNFFYFDKEGVVVESSPERLEEVPLITGLKFDRIMLKEKLDISKEGIFSTILDLTLLIKHYELPVETINFNSDYEVTLWCNNSILILGKQDYYDKVIAIIKSLLESADGRSLSYDLRKYSEENPEIVAKPIDEEVTE